MTHTCRTCAHCAWRDQYCAAKDTDLGEQYMTTPNTCRDYEQITND